MFDYFYGKEAERYVYFKVPSLLFSENHFKDVSCLAKLLYGFLLDRAGLSRKNGWVDENGRLFIYFQQEEVAKLLNLSNVTVIKLFNELENKIGLIERVKQGQGKPVKIYVKNFEKFALDTMLYSDDVAESSCQDVKNLNVLTLKNLMSRSEESSCQDVKNLHVSLYSQTNRTSFTESNQSIHQSAPQSKAANEYKSECLDMIDEMDYRTALKEALEQIEIDALLDIKNKNGNLCYSRNAVAELAELIAWVYVTPQKTIRINGVELDTQLVRERYREIDDSHIQYILDCMQDSAPEIKQRRNYLLTCLYNAPITQDGYYAAKVNHDFKYSG